MLLASAAPGAHRQRLTGKSLTDAATLFCPQENLSTWEHDSQALLRETSTVIYNVVQKYMSNTRAIGGTDTGAYFI